MSDTNIAAAQEEWLCIALLCLLAPRSCCYCYCFFLLLYRFTLPCRTGSHSRNTLPRRRFHRKAAFFILTPLTSIRLQPPPNYPILLRNSGKEDSPPQPPPHRPTRHGALGNIGPRHHAFVLQQREKLTIACQVDLCARLGLARFAFYVDLHAEGQLPGREGFAGGCHFAV